MPNTVERPPHVPPERVVDFDIYAPPGGKQDFHGAWKSLQSPGVPDLVWTPRNGGHWIPTRLDVIEQVLSEYQSFSTRAIILPREAGENLPLIPSTLQPPEHRPFRALLSPGLSPKAVRSIEDRIRALVVDLIERVKPDGQCNFTSSFAEILPIEIFLSLMDLPLEDVERTKYWADQIVRPDGSIAFEDAVQNLFSYLEPFVEARLGSDGDDMLSQIVNGEVFGRPLEKEEALKIALQVLLGGLDTVVNVMGFIMLFLAENPSHREQLIAAPSLIPSAVDELFRRFPVVTNAREVTQDMEFRGVQLAKGDMIAAATVLGGLDERRNERPMEVDFHRQSGEDVTFGTGIHRCPGANLARAEIRITIEEWLRRIPDFRISSDKKPQFTGGVVGVVDALPLVWDVPAQ